ncbi:MAG: KAP family NTPase [Olsenella sp.]|nr:KAP family NTPase [Olsenella sp.]
MQPEHIQEEILPDVPISSKSDDLFDRASWATQLAKIIEGIDSPSAFAVGIVGSWGSGKTSMLNMVVEELQDREYTTVRFSPWLFSSEEKILRELLEQLMETLAPPGSKSESRIVNLLTSYQELLAEGIAAATNLVAVTTTNPTVAALVNAARPIEKYVIKQLLRRIDATNIKMSSVEQLRGDIAKEMEKLEKNIVIVIDDIDRLDSSEIRLIFKLVNLTLSFPHIVFVLAYDEGVVCAALRDVQGISGERYLEKIIQLPITLPRLSSKQTTELVQKNIARCIESMPLYSHQDAIGQSMLAIVFQYLIYPSLETPRQALRFTNAVRIRSRISGKDIHPADLIAMTMIQIEYPMLGHWIWDNRNALCANSPGDLSTMNSTRSQLQSSFNDLLQKNGYISGPARVKEVMELLFPALRAESSNSLIKSPWSSDISGHVCRLRNLELFFTQYIFGSSERERLLAILTTSNWHETAAKMEMADKAGLLDDLIDLAVEQQHSFSAKQLASISSAMLYFSGFARSAPGSAFQFSPDRRLYETSRDMLDALTEEARKAVVLEVLNETDHRCLYGPTYFIRDERLAQMGKASSHMSCVSIENYIEIASVYISKVTSDVKEILSDGNSFPIIMAGAISNDYPDKDYSSRWTSTRNEVRKNPYYAMLFQASDLTLFTSLSGSGKCYQLSHSSDNAGEPESPINQPPLPLAAVISDPHFAEASEECKTRIGALYLLHSRNLQGDRNNEVSGSEAREYLDAEMERQNDAAF